MHRLVVAGLIVMSTACGTPAETQSPVADTSSETSPSIDTQPPTTELPATSLDDSRVGQFTRCTPAPFTGGPPPSTELVDALAVVGPIEEANTDVLSGIWWDHETDQFVATAVDQARATEILTASMPAGFTFRVELVPYSRDQQASIQDQAAAAGYGSSGRVWDGRVEIVVPVLDDESLARLATEVDAPLDAVCITGADPATVPADGPQPTEGDGWRLLADEQHRGGPWEVHIARDEVEYDTLWTSLMLDANPPAVDFEAEIVVHFSAVYSGSCPEIRLDGVVFGATSVRPEIVQLGGLRACTADANARAYVVAVPRDRLPAVPFTVASTTGSCGGCEPLIVESIDGERSNVAQLQGFERSQILAASAAQRVGPDNSLGGQQAFTSVRFIDTFAALGGSVDMDFDAGTVQLNDGERMTIENALAPIVVEWVHFDPALFDTFDPPLVGLGEPRVNEGHITIASSLFCGELCAIGGSHIVERADDGTWHTTEPYGMQWIS